jgi:hypothetical protein
MALGDKVQIVLEIEADLLEMSSPQQPRHSGKSTEVSSTALSFRGLCEPAGSPRLSRAGTRRLGRSPMTRLPQPRWELPNPRQLLSGACQS